MKDSRLSRRSFVEQSALAMGLLGPIATTAARAEDATNPAALAGASQVTPANSERREMARRTTPKRFKRLWTPHEPKDQFVCSRPDSTEWMAR